MQRTLLAFATLVALLAAGCIPALPGTTSRQTSETLTVLGSSNEVFVLGMTEAFEQQTGIRTSYVRLSAGEALERLRSERANPQFSVWWGGPANEYIAADAQGLLEEYRPRGFSQLPRQYKDENGSWTGVYVGVLALAVNAAVLQRDGLPEPTSWADLTNPVYKGQISMSHPATSGTAYTLLATIMQLNQKNTQRGFRYMEELHQNVRSYERAGADPARIAARGQAAIAVAFSHDIVDAMDNSADLKLIFPSEGTGYEIGGMALIKGAPNPEAGKRFMDWALTEQAQELGPSMRSYQIPTNPDARVSSRSAKLSAIKTIDFDFEWAGSRRSELVEQFNASIAPPPA